MKIDDGIFFVRGENKGRFPYCNVLLVENLLIDAGAGINVIRNLVSKADILILSHVHPDHASGAWIFNEAKKVVYAPKGDSTELDAMAKRWTNEKLAELWKEEIAKPIGMKTFKASDYEEGLLDLKTSRELRAIYMPGHTEDHHVILIDGKILFGADIDLTPFGPFYGNPEGDMKKFKKSIEKVMNLDVSIFVSAHSDPVFGREEIERRLVEYLSIIDKRDEILLEHLKEPKTIDELVKISPFYKKKPFAKEILDFFERNMIIQHLNELEKAGKIKRIDNKYVSL